MHCSSERLIGLQLDADTGEHAACAAASEVHLAMGGIEGDANAVRDSGRSPAQLNVRLRGFAAVDFSAISLVCQDETGFDVAGVAVDS